MKIGFIGLGMMGRGMAANLQKAGHELVVTELTRQAASAHLQNGAVWAETPRAVAEACELVFTSLPAPPDVEAVASGDNGLIAGLRKGSAWFDLSTNAVDVVRRLNATLAKQGVDFLDAPVSGGPGGAASGKMAIWVGGDKAVFDKYKKVLDAMSDQARYIGPIGAGSIAKLVHNMASSAINAIMAEVMTMGVKAGLEPLPLWEAIRQGAAGRMRSFENISNRFLPGTLDPPNFALRLAHKDIMLALQLGREFGVPMRLCNLVGQEMTEAMTRGWGGRDSQSFLLLQQERAGVPEFKIPVEQIKAVKERARTPGVPHEDAGITGRGTGIEFIGRNREREAAWHGGKRRPCLQGRALCRQHRRQKSIPAAATAEGVGRNPGCSRWGASAPQSPVSENIDPFYSWYGSIQPISEECLFLNVFAPGLDGGKRPVMFWIHGGGWRAFSGTAPGFDGTNLARAQDVVVVTINHRLSGFGFLQLEGSGSRFADAGSAGLLDIVAALHWVKENISAFGGDPDNVTVFGESGGASKIAALLAMRAAQGLFHKAILQSSAGGMRLSSPEEAGRHAANLAKALGRSKLDGEELQKVPMADLLAAMKTLGDPFRGTIDGRSFDGDPYHLAAPAISTDIPVMAGFTNSETTYHLRFDPSYYSLQYPDVKRRLTRFFEIDGAQVDDIISAYRKVYSAYGPSEILAMITSDFVFKRTAIRIAGLQAASAKAPVYLYMFERETPIDGGLMRAPHTSEVPFIFGTTAAAAAQLGTGSDIEPMTRVMMASWAAFARHGNPDNPTLPEWKPFKDDDRQTMVLNVESRLALDPGAEARAALSSLPYFGYNYSNKKFISG